MRSLRFSLLAWIVPPLAIVGLAAAGGAYVFMQHRLTAAYDQDLGDIARALVPYLRVNGQKIELVFNEKSDAVLRADSNDQIFYAVRDEQGHLIAGDASVPKGEAEDREVMTFWDTTREGHPIRAAMLYARVASTTVSVVAAETMRKRDSAARDALLSALAPLVLLIFAVVTAVIFGVRRGLEPLERLGEVLRRRASRDLRPLPEHTLAEELRPLVHALNGMFERLDESQAAQERFIANAAHQLRTPIAGLVTQLDLAAGGGPEAGARLAQARLAAQRLARLAQQILSLAAADPVSNAQSARAPCDLAEIVRSRAAEWVQAAPKADMEFDLSPARLRGDAVLLGELAANLVDNATRYGGTAVRISTGQRDGRAWLEVQDNGRGIPVEARTRIFERFQRLEANTTEGSGLGLAIVSEIAQRHGGEVAVDDAPGGGTRVTVLFAPLS
jgi:two-component system sensor histidine kinase TctE